MKFRKMLVILNLFTGYVFGSQMPSSTISVAEATARAQQRDAQKEATKYFNKSFYRFNKDDNSRKKETERIIKTATNEEREKLKRVGVINDIIQEGNFDLARWMIENNVYQEAYPLFFSIYGFGGPGSQLLACDILEKNMPERLEFAKYLIHKGFDINKTTTIGGEQRYILYVMADKLLRSPREKHCLSKTFMEKFIYPLTQLYLNSNIDKRQLDQALAHLSVIQSSSAGGYTIGNREFEDILSHYYSYLYKKSEELSAPRLPIDKIYTINKKGNL